MFESGVQRIGAEQEFCLIDYSLKPSMVAMELLQLLNDGHFTTELAKFNLEANLDPLKFEGDCFSLLENNLVKILTKANKCAHALGSKIILTGILPSIKVSDIRLENIAPDPRYMRLNEAILNSRGQDFEFNIRGLDELITKHNSVLFESCNTSFQVHFQVNTENAIEKLNWAQAISGPVLAACVNSPLFLGKRLWPETRIALFQQSADTRKSVSPLRREPARVSFGNGWASSVLDKFKEAAGRHKILLTVPIDQLSSQELDKGNIPKLKALCVHNSTIYHWNRLCYGITEGVPHLRIENRYLPSGPSIVDETANAAFWTGLMNHIPEAYENISGKMDFDTAKNNFLHAAKSGMRAQFNWPGHKFISASDLIAELLPIAKKGLEKAHVSQNNIEKYLGIIEQRTGTLRTGSSWMLNSFNGLKKSLTSAQASIALTEGIYQRQKSGEPVHLWTEMDVSEGGGWHNKYRYVEQIMSKELITVQEDDLIDLARNIMLWNKVHHIPVENSQGELTGLISSTHLMAELGKDGIEGFKSKTVGEVMVRKIISVPANTKTIDAYHLMKEKDIGCLPVTENGKLIGIITVSDYVKLLEYFFKGIRKTETDHKQKKKKPKA